LTELVTRRSRSGELPTNLDEVKRFLAETEDPREVANLYNLAEAARRYAQSHEAKNYAAEVKLRAARRGGELLARNPDFGRGKKSVTLTDLLPDFTENQRELQSSRWQKLAGLPEPAFENRFIEVRAAREELTMADFLAYARRVLDGQSVVASDVKEWYTPAVYIEAARKVLKQIDLDPASCAEANETVKASHMFTTEDDGLSQDWLGKVFLNPPYGHDGASRFIPYLIDQFARENVTAAIALVNSHCTDSQWFQALWEHTLCFTDHRIDFAAGGMGRAGSTHGSVFVYLGPDQRRFAGTFGKFGAVVRRWPE
jgi:ParB family chromosome partitioning protein